MDATWQVYLHEVLVVLVIDVSDTQTRHSFFCIDILYNKRGFLLWRHKNTYAWPYIRDVGLVRQYSTDHIVLWIKK